MGLNLSVHVYWNTQTSTDRDIKRRWHVILGVQSAFRLAGRTNVSQTSVSKVTELMRPLQTKAFCSPVLQLKACQTIQLIDVERCQSVSCFSNQTNNNAFFCFYFILFLHLTQEDDNKAAAVSPCFFTAWCPLIRPSAEAANCPLHSDLLSSNRGESRDHLSGEAGCCHRFPLHLSLDYKTSICISPPRMSVKSQLTCAVINE